MSKLVAVTLLLNLAVLAMASGVTFTEQDLYPNERDDLLQLRDSLSSLFNTVHNLYFNWTGSPCSGDQSLWFGIACSKSRVVAIDLAGAQLTGSLPPSTLQNLWYLADLDLSGNAIHGALPTLKNLINLRAVSFARNQLSGSIPTEFLDLPNLSRLELQENRLNGTIPAFDQQALRAFNVSHNSLEGRIPNNSVMQGFPTASFAHNLQLCGRPLAKPCSSPPSPARLPPSGRSSSAASPSGQPLRPWIFVLVSIAAVAAVFIGVSAYLFFFKRSAKKAKRDPEFAKKAKGPVIVAAAKENLNLVFSEREKMTFNLDDLMRSPAELIGKGEMGSTFRATLESGRVVVVRRLHNFQGMSREEFFRQMDLLGRLRHENLVEIISFHYSEEKIVVYEHITGGSLFHLLHDNRGEGRIPLRWAGRLNIVKGMARGLAHLHQCLPYHRVPHANLKSSNVLIAHGDDFKEFHPKLADAGFQPILPWSQIHKLAIGKAPEVSASHDAKLTDKADVYCFGLVLLEIITGRETPSDEEEDLAAWVRSNVRRGQSTEILDLEIVGEKESHGDVMKLIEVALECVDLEPQRRPTMNDVLKRVEEFNAASNDGKI